MGAVVSPVSAAAGASFSTTGAPVTVLVCALGGEGGGVLAEWLYTAAQRAGFAAQSTSIPGVAQRTGATTYYIEICPLSAARLAGRRPVFSLSPVPGGIDLLVSSELLEAVRQAGAGMANPLRTQIISSTARALTVAEKMQMGDGRADSAQLAAALQAQALSCHLLDLGALARQADTAISAVLLGAMAGSGRLPMPRAAFEEAIRAAGKGVATSLKGFSLAFDAVAGTAASASASLLQGSSSAAPAQAAPLSRTRVASTSAGPAAAASTNAFAAAKDLSPQQLRVLAHQRLLDYQDEPYAALYEARLKRLDAADGATADEATRWLALWMAFDDVVHVAGLKLASSRQARVRREAAALPGDIVKVFDHFKPGVPELAGLLPAGLATRLVAWDRRRVAAGREPWALPLRVGTHSVLGSLALRFMASLKGWRRRGQRFGLEQQLIERWLAACERGGREHGPLGLELARCGRLVKGYGSTNERGKENLLHIVEHLAFADGPAAARVQAVRAAREAALADDGGISLDATLRQHGAPARAPREHVVRWFKRRPGESGA
jgi:indolepyruvate ferredoxin oxidoreductase, beta subunit